MSREIQSDALQSIGRVLDVPGLSGTTVLDGGNLSQVLPVVEIIRRSRTPGISTGWFNCILLNSHAIAGEEQSDIDPYAVAGSAFAPYPATVPAGFDFWLLRAAVRRTVGAGTLDGAILFVDPLASQQGWGQDDGGAQEANNLSIPVGLWTALNTSTTTSLGIAGDGSAMVTINQRIPPGSVIRFVSDVAGASADIICQMVCGLFVEGLGQDIAQ